MKSKPRKDDYLAKLRAKAEKQLGKKITKLKKQSAGDHERVLNELNAHQIELEMQNEQLRNTEAELEQSRSKYADLYDFAPIGYFTIDKNGIILEANLTGCRMLGVERRNLIKKPFRLFVDKKSQDDFYRHHKKTLTAGLNETCELTLVNAHKEKFEARLDSVAVIDTDDHVRTCRVSVIDITEQKFSQKQVIDLAKFPAEDPFPVLRINCEGRIIYSNQPGQTILQEWNSGIGQKAPKLWCDIISEALDTNQYLVKELTCGEQIFSITVAPVIEVGYVNLYGKDITKRKQAEERVEQSEKKYRSLFETMSEGFALHEIIYDKKGKPCDYRYLEANPAFEELTGLKPEDIIGKTARQILPDIEQYRIDTYGKVALTGKSKSFENFTKTLGRYYDVFAYRPSPNQFATIFVDITERKQAEEALRQSKEREKQRAEELNTVLESIPTPVFIVHDPDSSHITGNIAADELLRQPRGDELSLSASNKTKPKHFKAIKDGRELKLNELPAQRAARGEKVKDFDFDIVFNNGTILNVVGYGTPLFDDKGKPRGAVHVLVDITERKKAEAALRESEERLRSLAENVPCVLMRFDRKLRIVYLNTQSERYNPNKVEQMIGRTNRDMGMPVELCDLWEAATERVFSTCKPEEMEFNLEGPSGMRTFALKFAPEYGPDGAVRYVLGVSLDITERKKAEEELRQSNDELSRFNTVAVGRELRIIELKKEINRLCAKAGEPEPFPLEFEKEQV